VIGQHWSLNVNLAVRKLWHAAEMLGFQADTLDPKHVAMTAATHLSRDPLEVLGEIKGKSSDSEMALAANSATAPRKTSRRGRIKRSRCSLEAAAGCSE
jgi:hypothetical protein